jgi:hypothetical protein
MREGFLMPRWEGPFKICAQLNPVTYRVENESRLFPVHVQWMAKYFDKNEFLRSMQH